RCPMGLLTDLLKSPIRLSALQRSNGSTIRVSKVLVESARAETDVVLQQLGASTNGLNTAEIMARLDQYGLNEVARENRRTALSRLLDNIKNPLVILLSF